MIMSDFLSDLGKGLVSGISGNIVNGAFGLLGNSIAQDQAKKNFQEQWDKYLSPKAQVKNLAAAGLNPAVAMGNQSPVMTSAGLDLPSNPLGGIGTSSLSEISNYLLAKAQAHKAGVEAEGTELDNIVKAKTQEDRIKEISLRNKWTEEQTTKCIQEWSKIVGEINVLQKDADIKEIDLKHHEELVNAILRNYRDKHNLDEQQFNALKDQLPVILDKMKAEKDVLEVDAEIAQSFKGTMASLGVVGQVVNVISTLLKVLK